MLVNFISESDAEQIYGDRCVEVDDSYTERELQAILNDWLEALPDHLKNEFGTIDYDDAVSSLEQLIDILPDQLHARITNSRHCNLFI